MTHAASGFVSTAHPEALAAAGPLVLWRRRVEVLALVYLLIISSGALGFVDLITFGDSFKNSNESAFAQLLWPIAYLLFGGLAFLARREILAVLPHARWALIFPAVAAFSFLWSADPVATVNGTVRIGMTTLMAILIGTRFDLHEIARAVFLVLAAAIALSFLAALGGTSWAQMDDGALRGLFHHKNVMGSRAALLFGVSLALLVAGWRPGIALAGLVAGLAAVILSKSATGLALAVMCVLVMPVAVMLRARVTTLVFGLVVLGGIVAFAVFLIVLYQINPVVEILHALGRDVTLTGRILLWDAALQYFEDRPLAGTGFDAFWQGRLDWRILIVLDELGNVLHFHNSFLEVSVQLGMIGLLAVAATFYGFARSALLALRWRADRLAHFPAIFAAVAVAVGAVEAELFVQHKVLHILLVALGVAATRQALLVAAYGAWHAAMSTMPPRTTAEASHANPS